MYQIAAAVRALGTRDWFDYLSVIAPLVLSVVAIAISLFVAHKQNRIALFTIRHDAIVDIRTILLFESKICDDLDNKLIKVFYDGAFGTDVTNKCEKDAVVQIFATTTRLEKSALVKILVPRKDLSQVHDVIISMQQMMLGVVADEAATIEKAEFHKACDILLNGSYKKLCKAVRI